jgi:glycosyltransferase involved in cell wall biosynthesis
MQGDRPSSAQWADGNPPESIRQDEKKPDTMKVSIVTVSYNQYAYLKEAMDSVLDQEYPDLEYIVVDPGSTDGSRELIQSYGGRVSKAILEPDKGAADGLNKGFAAAKGDVYGFLNSDDLLLPGSLKRVADFFSEHPECDMVMGNGYKIDGKGNRLKHIKARDFSVRRHLYGGTRWLQQSTFFRREAYLSSPGFNTKNTTSWDGELFVTMVNQGAKVGYIDCDLSAFRIHGTSISGTGRMWDTYKKDNARVFRNIQGRDWGPTDDLRKFLYRLEGVALKVTAGFQSLMKRNAV